MNKEEAMEAMEKRWKVQLTRRGHPYIGILNRELGIFDKFLFEGEREGKILQCDVRPEEISLLGKEE